MFLFFLIHVTACLAQTIGQIVARGQKARTELIIKIGTYPNGRKVLYGASIAEVPLTVTSNVCEV